MKEEIETQEREMTWEEVVAVLHKHGAVTRDIVLIDGVEHSVCRETGKTEILPYLPNNDHIKDMDENEYNKLKSSGLLWEIFPECTGEFAADMKNVFTD